MDARRPVQIGVSGHYYYLVTTITGQAVLRTVEAFRARDDGKDAVDRKGIGIIIQSCQHINAEGLPFHAPGMLPGIL